MGVSQDVSRIHEKCPAKMWISSPPKFETHPTTLSMVHGPWLL